MSYAPKSLMEYFDWYHQTYSVDLSISYREYLEITGSALSPDAILSAVCQGLKINIRDLLSKNRYRELVDGRKIAAFLLRKAGYTLKYTGIILGGRDHTTIIHLVGQYEDHLFFDSEFAEKSRIVIDLLPRTETQKQTA